MEVILAGLAESVRLLITGDPDVVDIALRTMQVSGISTLISVVIGIPFGTSLALRKFFGRGFIVSFVNFAMGLPPVVVGLITWLMLTRYGPMGALGLLYSPTAMILAQAVIASPIVAGFTLAAVQSMNPKLGLQILSFGANRLPVHPPSPLGIEAWDTCCNHCRFWKGHKRGWSVHDGRRKCSGLHTGPDHGHGP